MHIYRYRPLGMLSQKELLYDEMYFASKDELNDPLDMLSNFGFSDKDGKVWPQFLDKVLVDIKGNEEIDKQILNDIFAQPYEYPQNKTEYVKYAVEYLKSKNFNYEELLNNFCTHKKAIIKLAKQSKNNYESELTLLLDNLKSFLSRSNLNSGYSVSFSESNDNMLMWSHYSSGHKGYCLIFRPIDEHLQQCPLRKKKLLTASPDSMVLLQEKFKVESMTYNDTVTKIDAFKLFGSAYTGYPIPTDEMLKSNYRDILSQYCKKNKCWDYERERRLRLSLPSNTFGGEEPCFTPTQRLFYYDFSQVKGIIFGARMPKQERDTIKEIIQSKLENKENKNNDYFMYQEAEICSSSRGIKVIDLDLVLDGKTVAKGRDGYDKKLAEWEKHK